MNIPLLARHACLSGTLLATLGGYPAIVRGQTPTTPAVLPVPSGDASESGNPAFLRGSAANTDPQQSHMLHKMMKERNVLRQEAIVTDTRRLVDLANQLKDAVDKSNKDQLSLNVVNTANEIEKLAKAIKEKMRDGE